MNLFLRLALSRCLQLNWCLFQSPHSCTQVCLDLPLRKGSGFFVSENTSGFAGVVEKYLLPHSYMRLTSFHLPRWFITCCFFLWERNVRRYLREFSALFIPASKLNLLAYELKCITFINCWKKNFWHDFSEVGKTSTVNGVTMFFTSAFSSALLSHWFLFYTRAEQQVH